MKNYLLAAALAMGSVCCAAPVFAQIPTGAELVGRMDKDSDKGITRQEWEASGSQYPYAEEADTDKDGKLSAAELDAFLAQFGGGGTPAQAQSAPAPAGTPAAQPRQ